MTSDGQHYSGYDPALIETVLGEAAYLLRHLGFAAAHTVLIGGVVPSLLVLGPATNRAHLGTTDLDFCLSLAIVEGDTAEYQRIETALRKAGYEPTDASFRWRRTSRVPLEIEFFCPADDGRPPGKLFRPKADNPTAKQNFGPKLGAIALAAGQAIGSDVFVVEREVYLPEEGGKTRFAFRVTGVLELLPPQRRSRRRPRRSFGLRLRPLPQRPQYMAPQSTDELTRAAIRDGVRRTTRLWPRLPAVRAVCGRRSTSHPRP